MLSLYNIKTHIQNPPKALSLKTLQKRASLFSSFSIKGSMALEGSLVLPLFLFYMMTLLYCFEIIRFQSDVFEAMHQAADNAWIAAYENTQTDQKDSHKLTLQTGQNAKKSIWKYLQEQQNPYLCVAGKASGITIETKQNDIGEGNLHIAVSYNINSCISWLPIDIGIKDHVFIHGFVGYRPNENKENSAPESYVYITPSGTKYHFYENCTYLKVKLLTADKEELPLLRNASGERYRLCEVCRPTESNLLFYTRWGNRYHANSNCSAIKRTVYCIPISQVGTRTACKKCG